jgi:small subunit ribosomal protein S16
MHHLLKGVSKGAMTEEQAQAKFEEWKTIKTSKIESAKNDIGLKAKTEDKKRLAAEVKVNQAKADALAKKLAAEAKKAAGIVEAEEVAEEVEEAVEAAPEVVAEVAPEVVAEAALEVVAEAAEEAAPEVVAEVAPEVVAEVAEEAAPEAPATEEKEKEKE